MALKIRERGRERGSRGQGRGREEGIGTVLPSLSGPGMFPDWPARSRTASRALIRRFPRGSQPISGPPYLVFELAPTNQGLRRQAASRVSAADRSGRRGGGGGGAEMAAAAKKSLFF